MASWGELHKQMTVEGPHPDVAAFAEGYLKPGMRVLDHGCGKGRHAIYLAKKGIEVHAVDIEESALTGLRNEAEKDQLFELLKVERADIRELPYPDEYFDAILSINVVNHGYWADMEQFFKEATRVLKKSGLFHIIGVPIEYLEDTRKPGTKELEKGTFINLNAPDGDLPHHLFTKDELRKLLSDYEIIKMRNMRENSEWMKREIWHFEVIARKK